MKSIVAGYADIEEFKKDLDIYIANQNDRVFMNAVSNRVNMSSKDIQVAIKDELVTALMETNPALFIKRISSQLDPKCWMIVKDFNDPFFEV
jgi:hypothetical protein